VNNKSIINLDLVIPVYQRWSNVRCITEILHSKCRFVLSAEIYHYRDYLYSRLLDFMDQPFNTVLLMFKLILL